MFYMESRLLLNLSVQNALHCISENFNHKIFRRDACARNSLERCAVRSPDGRYSAHIATTYYISRHPLSQNPLSAPGSILLDSFILHGRRQKTVIACLYIHILKLLKLWNSTSESNYQTFNKIQAKGSFGRHVGGQEYALQHGRPDKSYYFVEQSKCDKISPLHALPLKFLV